MGLRNWQSGFKNRQSGLCSSVKLDDIHIRETDCSLGVNLENDGFISTNISLTTKSSLSIYIKLHSVRCSFGCSVVYNFYFEIQIIKKSKTLIILIIWIFKIYDKFVRKNLIKISKNQKNQSLIFRFFWFFDFLINYVLLFLRSVTDWQRQQDVRSHDNNSISCFVLMPQYIKKHKDD